MRHKGGDPDGKRGGHELGRVEGGETSHDILYVKKSIFNKRDLNTVLQNTLMCTLVEVAVMLVTIQPTHSPNIYINYQKLG